MVIADYFEGFVDSGDGAFSDAVKSFPFDGMEPFDEFVGGGGFHAFVGGHVGGVCDVPGFSDGFTGSTVVEGFEEVCCEVGGAAGDVDVDDFLSGFGDGFSCGSGEFSEVGAGVAFVSFELTGGGVEDSEPCFSSHCFCL